jgi:hypothetical protein
VLFGNGVFAPPPTAGAADSIANGNSSVAFTGTDGDIIFTIDEDQVAELNSDNFVLDTQEKDRFFVGSGIVTADLQTGFGLFPQFNFIDFFVDGKAIASATSDEFGVNDGTFAINIDGNNFASFGSFRTELVENDSAFVPGRVTRRSRGERFDDTPVQDGDQVFSEGYIVHARETEEFFFIGGTDVFVDSNDEQGNVSATTFISMSNDLENSNINLQAKTIAFEEQFGPRYAEIDEDSLRVEGDIISNGFITHNALSSNDLANITGSVGQTVAVSDEGGKLAYWDTTNNRWSFVFDNSAV